MTNILILQVLFPTSTVSRLFTLFKNLKYALKSQCKYFKCCGPFKHNHKLYCPLNFKNQDALKFLYNVSTIPLYVYTKRHVY